MTKILVCAKQVPDTTEMKIDPETNTLIRKGVPSILNTYDAYALEKALQLRDQDPDNVHIVVVSMGPPQAKDTLRECLAVGAESAYLVTDRKFGGADTLATSYTLVNAIKKIEETEGEFDMIFCGLQAIDGDTAQVGPEMAEQLDIAQITYAIDIKKAGDELIHVTREYDGGKQVVEGKLPCLVTFTKTDDLRYPTIKNKMKARKTEIHQITYDDLTGIDDSRLGLSGSPTRVRKSYSPEQKVGGIIIHEDDLDLAFEKLVSAFEEDHVF